jgi:hypothetical protein
LAIDLDAAVGPRCEAVTARAQDRFDRAQYAGFAARPGNDDDRIDPLPIESGPPVLETVRPR